MNFNDSINFYWQEKRDQIRRYDNANWKLNFKAYAAKESSNNTIKIYKYSLNATLGLTTYLFLKENTNSRYKLDQWKSIFYIPGRFEFYLFALI